MSPVASTMTLEAITSSGATSNRSRRTAVASAQSLERWLKSPFVVIDTTDGSLVAPQAQLPAFDWSRWNETLTQVAQVGRPALVEEEDPLAILAVPLAGAENESLVAVSTFLTRPVHSANDFQRAAQALGRSGDELLAWSHGRKVADPTSLEQMADLVLAKLAADSRIAVLEHEVDELAQRIGATYEEISLIYRLTQNLKLSDSREALAELALEWLAEVVRTEGAVIQFHSAAAPRDIPGSEPPPTRHQVGACPLDQSELDELFRLYESDARHRPVVVNQAVTRDPAWRFPQLRETVIVPITEGSRVFGWLAIFNHPLGQEFGTSEASLLSSIGTIIGIHAANADLYREQSEMLADVVRAMSSAIDAKDPYTRGHSDRVARVAVRLARELGCDDETAKVIYLSGLLHDIGKIGINDDVLRKPGRLTEPEFEHVKTHVTIGYKILKDLRKMQHMLPVVLHHHESWDGNGYPHGLKGEDIPYLARIVAVADSYDAMTSDRPYRRGLEIERVDAILRKGAGQQWDARIVEAYFACRNEIAEIVNRGVDDNELAQLQWS
jgi:putative nucleotidyltransferase with HDIG domain